VKQNLIRWMTIAAEAAIVIGVLFVLYHNVTLRRSLKVTSKWAPRFNARGYVAPIAVFDLAGKSMSLDLRTGRSIVAIIDPECATCAATMEEAQRAPNVLIVSVGDPAQTRKLLGNPQSGRRTFVFDRRRGTREVLGAFPQVFAVDDGKVVRTCSSVRECL
jgi:hypothetical protein